MDATMTNAKNQMNNKAHQGFDEAKKAVASVLDTPIANQIADRFSSIKDQTVDAYDSSLDLVRKNPVTSVAAALGVGVLAGLLLRRRH